MQHTFRYFRPITKFLAGLALLISLIACSAAATPAPSTTTEPVATAAPTAITEPTQVRDGTPTPEPSAPTTPTTKPTSVVANTTSPAPSPTPRPQPTPTLTPEQNLLAGLSWTKGNLDRFEQRAVSALRSIAGQNINLARFLAGSSWVSDGVNSTETAAIETFASISSADVELGGAMTDLEWLKGASVSVQTKEFWLQSFLDLAPFPDVSIMVASLPWVVQGHTGDRRVVQRNLALIAQNDTAFLAGLLELP